MKLARGIVLCFLLASSGYAVDEEDILFAHRDIPKPFDGLRIAFVTDIHHGPMFSRQEVREVVEQLHRIAPDVVLLGGDYVYREAKYIDPCFRELAALRTPVGVYGVLGNHDHWIDADLVRKHMQTAHITRLENRGIWLYRNGGRLRLCGIGDLWESTQDIPSALGGAMKNDFVILLSHNPDIIEKLSSDELDRVDLVLSGHTHGGQVTFFGWAPFVPSAYGRKYLSGMSKKGATTLLVSNGVGKIGVPFRLFAPARIHVITLKCTR